MKKIIRDKNHLAFIRSLPCCVCPNIYSEAAHIRKGTDGGMGLKPSDCWTVPLCRTCHNKQHNIGESRFWRGKLQDARNLANLLYSCTGQDDLALSFVLKFRRKK